MSVIHELPRVEQPEELQPHPVVQEVEAVEVTHLEDARQVGDDEHAHQGAEPRRERLAKLVKLAVNDLKRVYAQEYAKNLTKKILPNLDLHTPLLEDGYKLAEGQDPVVIKEDGENPRIVKAEADWVFDEDTLSSKKNARMLRGAEQAAREDAWNAVHERKAYIDANGGPKNILKILQAEKDAAQAADDEYYKPEFMGRVEDFAKQVEVNESRPADMSEEDWYTLSDTEKTTAIENEAARTTTLAEGDTIWEIASKRLGEGATTEEIDQETQRILDLNNIKREDAPKLQVGAKIKLS